MIFPLATLSAVITNTGISAPQYTDILLSLEASFQSIYGTDAYIEPDSQDGQLLAIFAKAISECNDMAIAVYNSYSPATAQGVALSNAVKINGIDRASASNSQVSVELVGQVGTIINSGLVSDGVNQWELPASVTIPPAGFILVTATCATPGAISALSGTVIGIVTPTLGWQSVSNPSAASPGSPVETDASLRSRQLRSVALPSRTVLEGIVGAVKDIAGVTVVQAYENDTNLTDVNGLPPHSFSLVVLGGDSTEIANEIAAKKTPGAGTYGTTNVIVTDSIGISNSINFYIPTPKTIKVAISVDPLTTGYSSAVGTALVQAIVDYINAIPIGADLERVRLYLPAQLYGMPESLTYNVTNLQIAISPGAVGNADLVLAFNERAVTTTADVTLTLV